MLEAVFSKIFQMSLIGCCSIGLVLAVRLLLIRCGRVYAYQLWVLMFVSLCLPVSLPGNYSLIPRQAAEFSIQEFAGTEPVLPAGEAVQEQAAVHRLSPGESVQGMAQDAEDGIEDIVAVRSGKEEQDPAPVEGGGKNWIQRAGELWLLGVLLFTAGILWSVCRMSWRCARYRQTGCRMEDRIVETEHVPSPFLWGFFRPVIYLPAGLKGEERDYILAHETVHRNRRDHLIRFLILGASVLHWFNPLVWIAYAICCIDMEISCDEAVLGDAGLPVRKAYAKSLLNYAARQNRYILNPLGFGEPSLKSRIQNVLRCRRKSVWISMAAGVCVAGVAVGFLHYPSGQKEPVPDREQEAELLPEGEELQRDVGEGLVEAVDDQGRIGTWEPEGLTPGREDDSWRTAWMVGQPTDPRQSGWDPEQVKNAGERPAELAAKPNASEKGQIYLLGETRYWTLYGKGDGSSMLLARNGRYTQIDYPYAAGRRGLPMLMEADFDQDKITELAIVLPAGQENGDSADALLVADFQNNGAWVYQLTQEELNGQLAPHIASERTKTGLQAFVHGEPAGAALEDEADGRSFQSVRAGRKIRYFFDEAAKKILVRAELEFYDDADPEEAGSNGWAATARVIWAADRFGLHAVGCAGPEDGAAEAEGPVFD